MTSRTRLSVLTALAGILLASPLLAACSAGSSAAEEVESLQDEELPTEIDPEVTLQVGDQSEWQQQALGLSGELDELDFPLEFGNFVGGPEILEAIRGDSVDVAWVGDTPPIHAAASGEAVPIVFAARNVPSYRLATSPQSGVESLEDLEGQRIAYAEGTADGTYILKALDRAGLGPEDVELVRLQLAEFPEALATNEVDVSVLAEPRLTRYLDSFEDDGASLIPAEETEDLQSGLSYLYARHEALQDPAKAAAIRSYVEHFTEAVAWINDHQDDWVTEYYVETQGISEEDARRVVEANGQYVFPALDEDLIAEQQRTIDAIDDAGELPTEVSAEDIFDLRFDEVIDGVVSETSAVRSHDELD